MYRKLLNAIKTKGVVISTPTAVKSIMLKFLEMLHIIEDDSLPRIPQMESDAAELGRVLALFRDGVLIMVKIIHSLSFFCSSVQLCVNNC